MNAEHWVSPSERWAVGAACLGAPLAALIAQWMLVSMPREASLFATLQIHANTWWQSHMLLSIWLVLLVPLIWGMGQLLNQQAPFYRLAGSLLAISGVIINAVVTGVDFVLGAIAPFEAEMALGLLHQQIVATIIQPLDSWDTSLPLGLLLLSIALYRTRRAPQWLALLLVVSLAIPATTELRLVAFAAQLIAFASLGIFIVRQQPAQNTPKLGYPFPLAGAVIAALGFLPGAFISYDRLGFAVVVAASILLPALLARRSV